MIEIIPAISIVGNKVARINHCDINDITLYDESPLDMALRFEDHGIKKIHLIDLEGAQKGRVVNVEMLERIAGYTKLIIDFGGGITDDDDIRLAFEHGANMVHSASTAAMNREMFSSWIISYGRNKIMLSVDSENGKVLTRGWFDKTEIDPIELIEYYEQQGLTYIKATDIVKDGKMAGPAIELYSKILNKFPEVKLIASGGIQSVQDIEKLQELGVSGVIFAKSFYEGKIKLEDLQKFLV